MYGRVQPRQPVQIVIWLAKLGSGRITGYSEVLLGSCSLFNNSELAHAVWRNPYRKVLVLYLERPVR